MSKAVLFFKIFYEAYTGGVRTTFNIAELLDRKKFKPVIVTNKESELTADLRKIGLQPIILQPSEVIGESKGKVPRGIRGKVHAIKELLTYNRKIEEVIRREKIEVVYARNIKGVLMTGWACRKMKVPLIWDIAIEKPARGIVPFLFTIGFLLSKKVVLEADAIVEQTFPKWQQRLFRDRFKTIPSGIPVDRAAEFEACNPKPWVKGEPFRLLNVATINARKNQKMLIEAVRRLSAEHPYLELHIVGPETDAQYGSELKELVRASGLEKKVFFHGWQSEMFKFINQSHLFVLSSHYEGIPYAIMEAMHAKLPVLSTACGGVPNTITDGTTGWITPIGDIPAFTAKLNDILQNPQKLREVAQEAYAYVHREHDARVWCKRYEEFFDDVIKRYGTNAA